MSIKSAKKRKRKLIEDSWSIDYAFSKWIVPRLDLLIKRDFGHPCTVKPEEWIEILTKMKDGFKAYSEGDVCFTSEATLEKTDESLALFKKYFYNLWD